MPALGEKPARTHIVERLAQQFLDHRDPEAIEHTVKDLVGQRVFAQALGYEDLNEGAGSSLGHEGAGSPFVAAWQGRVILQVQSLPR